MSSKSRYILAAKQAAFQSELKKLLDSNQGSYIKRISFADYVRQLINEGVLTEPPPAQRWGDFKPGDAVRMNDTPYAKWSQAAVSLITKKFGVTKNSATPGYDKTRGVFVDFGGGYMSGSSGYLMGIPITSKEGSKTEGGGMLWDGFAGGSGLQEDGSYKSPWAWSMANISQGLTGNSQTQDQADQANYNNLKARADNIWGDEQNYVPVKAFSWGGQGKELTQAEAQKDPFYAWTKSVLDGYDSYKLGLDTKRWQRERNKFGMSNNISEMESIGLKYDGHSWYKNIFSDSEIPDLSTVEAYRANRDKLSDMANYATMVQKNNYLFDRTKRTAKDGVNLGFRNYTEYSQLTPQQLQIADQRVRGYNDYYYSKWLEKKAKGNYESSAKTKARQSGLKSLAIGALTGGIFSAAGLTASLTTATGLSAGVVTGGVVGGVSGGLQGGLEGALKGALIGGASAYAGEAIGGAINGGAASSLENQFYANTAQQFGDAITPSAFLPNLATNGVTGAIAGSGSGLLSQFQNSTKDTFASAITPESFLPNLGEQGVTDTPPSALANEAGDEIVSTVQDQLTGNDNQSNGNQSSGSQPASGDTSTNTTTYIPKITRTGGIFGSGNRAVGTGFAPSSPNGLPSYNTGIRTNTNGNGFGLLNNAQKRIG